MDSCASIASNPFNHLPDEIIHKIFTYLDVKSIKSFSLACKRPASVLASSSNLLNKFFKLKLRDANFWNDREKVLEVLSLQRNLCELELANIAGHHNVLTSIFQRFGYHITKLEICNSKIDDFTFREILRLSPMLNSLFLSEVSIIKKLPAINPIFMPNLKQLSVHYCDWQIFRFISRSQVQSLCVKNYLDEGNKMHLVNFLSSQFALRELILHGTSLRTLFQTEDVNNNCAYSLEKFCIDNAIGKNSDAVNWNVSTFLSLHDETLKNVEICGSHNEHITAFTLLNLNTITDLTLDVRGLPRHQDFYFALADEQRNTVLQNLRLRGFFFQQEFVKAILLRFPMIRNLEMNDWSNGSVSDLLHFISENLVYLQNLTITEISSSENIKLSALTQLTVQYIRNAKKLTSFIVKNDKIEALNVGLVYIGQIPNFVENLRDLSNIKYLSIGGNKTAIKEMLRRLVERNAPPEKLQTLELAIISGEDKEEKEEGGSNNRTFARKAIKLNLPFDRKDLNLKFNVLM